MKKKKVYLPFYHSCMITELIPKEGLCNCFDKDDKLLPLFIEEDKKWQYWGYDGNKKWVLDGNNDEIRFTFTPMRQTVVLLMAAMNGEL